tara:strand:- start:11 stop:235 length:225 start_codon:yes stop_codon:yes gene_type:complete
MNTRAEYERIKARIIELALQRVRAEADVEENKDPTKYAGLMQKVFDLQGKIKYNFTSMNELFTRMTPEEIRSLD